ncbi:MAG: hypothetical protein HY907_19790 [Deltaproteobacteria bacterium]|nr:hypothetical protein [Deltaproteobacteria bacterium]
MRVERWWRDRRQAWMAPALAAVLLLGSRATAADEPANEVQAPPDGDQAVTLRELADVVNPYGYWIDGTAAGRVWRPKESLVGPDFVPYLSGGWWTETPLGRQFGSIWPFGRVVFHYGRWFVDDNFGWVWSPGDDWSSAWVDWRGGEEFVGWSPSPPAELACRVSPRWVFVPREELSSIDLARHVLEQEAIMTAMVETKPGPQWGREPLACKHPVLPEWAQGA